MTDRDMKMHWEFRFDGRCFLSGIIVGYVLTSSLSPWFLIAAVSILFSVGRSISFHYRCGSGWSRD